MLDYVNLVRQFHLVFCHPAPTALAQDVAEDKRILRSNLITEETAEAVHALCGKVVDVVELADGLCDIIYVAAGGLVVAGYPNTTLVPTRGSGLDGSLPEPLAESLELLRLTSVASYTVRSLPTFAWLLPLTRLIECCTQVAERHRIPIEECFLEVQRSNMAKLWPDGKPHYVEDGPKKGKVAKPPTWTPPDLKSILIKHNVIK